MRTRYQLIGNNVPYFVTSTTVEWIPVFTKKQYFDIVIQSLRYCTQRKELKLFAYVVMDNHIHLIISGNNLSQIVKEFKSYTAREIINTAKIADNKWLLNQFKFHKKNYKKESIYQVWQEGFHPQIISTEDMLRQKIEYIHNNPVKRGIVERPEHWIYSSARNYFCDEGIIDIDLLEF